MKWYELSLDETVRELGTDLEKGLGGHEPAQRLAHSGPNELAGEEKASAIKLLLVQYPWN
jgi:magnesium-transporting ATPase (P-type)